MKHLVLLGALALSLAASAVAQDTDEFFYKRSDLLNYAAEQDWTLKTADVVNDTGHLPLSFTVNDIEASFGDKRLARVTLSMHVNLPAMTLAVTVVNDEDTWYEHIFNPSTDRVVYAYDIDGMNELSLAAAEPDGTKRWISFVSPDADDPRSTFAVHRPMRLPEASPLTLRLTNDQFRAIGGHLLELSDHNFINFMPY